jgi:transposase
MSLNGEQALTLYKGQSRVERGFRFLKDSTFRVSQILLKKTQRIQALLMVMVLTLFVYNYLERELRDKIKKQNVTVENLVKKQITNPTMKMVFFQFFGIHTITLTTKGETVEQIEDLDHKQTHILNILGENYVNICA